MMRKTFLTVAVAAAMLAGCQSTGSTSSGGGRAAADRTQTTAPQVVRGVYVSRGRTFQLPPGEWRVVDERTVNRGGPHSARQTFTVLASTAGKTIDRVAVLWVQYKTRYIERWSRYQGCNTTDRPNVYHAVVRANTGDVSSFGPGTKVDCWHVRAFSLGTSGDPHFTVRALWDYAKANGLYLPAVLVGARFAQKPEIDRRDYAEFLWNPDLIAPRPGGAPWRPEDFNAAAVRADPARKAAMDGLVAWAEDWRRRYPIASPAPSS